MARDNERRRELRVSATGMRARVRPGYRLAIVNLNSHGVLVDAGRPLRPGSYVEVDMETDATRGSVAARVMRCTVVALDPERGVTYRAALAFNESCAWVREALTPHE